MKRSREFLPLAGRRMRGMAAALIVGSALLTAIVVPHSAAGPPPDIGPDMPGKSLGKFTSYWVAPRVRISEEQVGKSFTRAATWYSEDGVASMRSVVAVLEGYVRTREEDQFVMYGINEDWKIVATKEPGPGFGSDAKGTIKSMSGMTRSTADSHVVVREYHPRGGEVALDIYIHGQATPTIGPFTQHLASGAQLNEDGSTAMLIWKDAEEKIPQLVVTDSSGKLSFRVDCEETDRSPMAGPNGVGAILPAPGASAHRNWFTWYTGAGKVRTLELTPEPYLIAWIPGTQRSLCSTSLGYVHRYEMIDWETGRKLWEIPCPGDGYALASGVTSKLALFSIAELYKGGPWRGEGWVLENGRTEFTRAFYAINADDGSLVARWQAKYPSRWSGRERDRFLRLGEKLFFVMADEVIELSEEDILLGKGGWERPPAAR